MKKFLLGLSLGLSCTVLNSMEEEFEKIGTSTKFIENKPGKQAQRPVYESIEEDTDINRAVAQIRRYKGFAISEPEALIILGTPEALEVLRTKLRTNPSFLDEAEQDIQQLIISFSLTTSRQQILANKNRITLFKIMLEQRAVPESLLKAEPQFGSLMTAAVNMDDPKVFDLLLNANVKIGYESIWWGLYSDVLSPANYEKILNKAIEQNDPAVISFIKNTVRANPARENPSSVELSKIKILKDTAARLGE